MTPWTSQRYAPLFAFAFLSLNIEYLYKFYLPTHQITDEGRIMTLKNLNHGNVQWSCRHSRAEGGMSISGALSCKQ
jgi:hypothetical protein